MDVPLKLFDLLKWSAYGLCIYKRTKEKEGYIKGLKIALLCILDVNYPFLMVL